MGRAQRRADRRAFRRAQLRGLRVGARRAGRGPATARRHLGLARLGERQGRAGCPADRRLPAARPGRRNRPGRLVPVGRDRRPRARRWDGTGRPSLRAHLRQRDVAAHRDRRREAADLRRQHQRGPLLGVPRRGRRQLRHRHELHAEDPRGRQRLVVLHQLAVGERRPRARARGRRSLPTRPASSPRSSRSGPAEADRPSRRSASTSARRPSSAGWCARSPRSPARASPRARPATSR